MGQLVVVFMAGISFLIHSINKHPPNQNKTKSSQKEKEKKKKEVVDLYVTDSQLLSSVLPISGAIII